MAGPERLAVSWPYFLRGGKIILKECKSAVQRFHIVGIGVSAKFSLAARYMNDAEYPNRFVAALNDTGLNERTKER